MGTDGYQTQSGNHLIIYANINSLWGIPETNVMYINCVSIQKEKNHLSGS